NCASLHSGQAGRISGPSRLLSESVDCRPTTTGADQLGAAGAGSEGELMGIREANRIAVVSCAIALLLTAAGTKAFAKDKTEPVPQWALDAAKIPTPKTVGDAKAVILFDEYLITLDEQNHAVERERSAVRILKLQG